MEDKKILKAAIAERGITQKVLAERLGCAQNSLSMNITRDRMSLDVFVDVLDALGYDVVVADRKTGKKKWTVTKEK